MLAEDAWRLVLGDAYLYLNQRTRASCTVSTARRSTSATCSTRTAPAMSRSAISASSSRRRASPNASPKPTCGPFVSGDPGSYRLRSVDGYSLPMSKVYLDQMGTAQVIRRASSPRTRPSHRCASAWSPNLDPGVSRAEFRFDGQSMEYRYGPIVPMSFKWPSDADGGRTSLVLEKMAGDRWESNVIPGPWSLFRLVRPDADGSTSAGGVMVLRPILGGLRANHLLLAQRTPNPFDSRSAQLRMPVQL